MNSTLNWKVDELTLLNINTPRGEVSKRAVDPTHTVAEVLAEICYTPVEGDEVRLDNEVVTPDTPVGRAQTLLVTERCTSG